MIPTFTDSDVNVVIGDDNVSQDDVDFLFCNEGWISMPKSTTIIDVLVHFKFFASKSDARRNWKRGDIDEGWNEFLAIGKLRRNIFVWKPTQIIFSEHT
jgi:hypothetical protein